jgi:hypothetical protein
MAMTEQPAPHPPHPSLKRIKRGLESVLFNSRWLMAPFYLGLVVGLAVLMGKFFMMLWEFILHAPAATEADIILGVLGLIDITLTGNLILIVVFSGYENFVSRSDPGGHPDWPEWMTKVDFAGLPRSSRSRRSRCWRPSCTSTPPSSRRSSPGWSASSWCSWSQRWCWRCPTAGVMVANRE